MLRKSMLRTIAPHGLSLMATVLLGGFLAVEEQDVGLYAAGIEDARRQPQQGMHVALLQQLAAHRLTRATLEQHIVGHHDRRPAGRRQQ